MAAYGIQAGFSWRVALARDGPGNPAGRETQSPVDLLGPPFGKLVVRQPIKQKVSMARLIGTDKMLFSTGDAVDSPFVQRGCRTKLTVKVENLDQFLENWSSGLHRVIFYGDHTRDVQRYSRFAQIRLVREGTSEPQKVDGLDWDPHVHA